MPPVICNIVVQYWEVARIVPYPPSSVNTSPLSYDKAAQHTRNKTDTYTRISEIVYYNGAQMAQSCSKSTPMWSFHRIPSEIWHHIL